MTTPKIAFMSSTNLPIYSILPDRLRVTVEDHLTNEFYHGWNVGVIGNDPHSDQQSKEFLEGFMAGSSMRLAVTGINPKLMWTLTGLKDGVPLYYCDIKDAEYAYFYGWNAAVNSVQLNAVVHDIIKIHGEVSVAHERCIDGYNEALDLMDEFGVKQFSPLKPCVGAGVGFGKADITNTIRNRTEEASITEEIKLPRVGMMN